MQSHQEIQQCMVPLMTINGDECHGSLPVDTCLGGIRTFPTPEEEASLLGKGDGSSGAPGHAPLQVEICRSVEPDEQTTAPVTSTAHHCHPSLKRHKFWEGIDGNTNNTGQWVSTYLKKDSWLSKWWEEFQPLTHSADGCCNDA